MKPSRAIFLFAVTWVPVVWSTWQSDPDPQAEVSAMAQPGVVLAAAQGDSFSFVVFPNTLDLTVATDAFGPAALRHCHDQGMPGRVHIDRVLPDSDLMVMAWQFDGHCDRPGKAAG